MKLALSWGVGARRFANIIRPSEYLYVGQGKCRRKAIKSFAANHRRPADLVLWDFHSAEAGN
jgi:hypothetical protein